MMVDSDIHTASLFKGYTSAEELHEGAETVVYRARTLGTNEPVILKVTKNEYPTAKELGRLRREFSILRELALPDVPKARALEEHGRGLALVMSDLGVLTLRSLLDKRRLSVEDALRIAISLSDVLSAIHRQRVIHKDITPRNVIVDEATMTTQLIDFGISARLAQEMQRAGGLAALEGTLVYIAPEQTGRMNRAIDLRADLYSLGAVLYEMLTGVVPFEANTPEELVHSHLARHATPPHERSLEVPQALSDIVMTLLAKTPEERYQSDAGLRVDLVECLQRWQATKSVAPFPLRARDKATELRRTQRLYGRERDIEALLQAFERACVRGPELCLISGYSGIGKSALVNEIHKLTAHQAGSFVSGKFDAVSRGAPLAPIAQAFRELILQMLTESAESLAEWKSDLLAALGGNGQLIVDLVPELELIIGPQPAVPALSADQARNRFELTLQNFLDIFASPDHPLVIFLDDLQWIDVASLNFLRLLLVDAYTKNVLLIGAYRANEVELGHPLLTMLEELDRAGLCATKIHLEPLDQRTVLRIVADTLTSSPDEVADLAALVYDKTQGNPFFAHRFMVTLNEKGLLTFDATAGVWRWDVDQIRAANVTDNVVDLMIGKLQELSPAARQALMLASCIGYHFDLRTLATIGEKTVAEIAGAVWEAMREGLVIALDNEYRLLEIAPGGAGPATIEEELNVRYQFVHDRILDAAYRLIEPARKQQLHLSIGRLLRGRSGAEPRDEDLLEIVRHLNLGAKGITDAAERLTLARFDERAGRKARATAAYRAAADYFRAGIEVLHDADWETDYDLCFTLYVDGAECEYLAGDVARANVLFTAVLPRAKTDVERASIYGLRARILTSLGKFGDAIKVAGEGLVVLGFPWNLEAFESPDVFMGEVGQIWANLGERRIEDVLNAPEISDPKLKATLELLDILSVPTYNTGPTLFGVLMFKAANLALKHGNTDVCGFFYVSVGYVLGPIFGRVTEGMAFAKLAADLLKKFPNPMMPSRLSACYGACLCVVSTMREVEAAFTAGRQAAQEAGDFSGLGVAAFLSTLAKLASGDQLEEALNLADENLALVRRTKEPVWISVTTVCRQAVANLVGRTLGRTTLTDESFNEEAFLQRIDTEHLNPQFHYYFVKTQLDYLYGRYEEAFAAGEKAAAKSFIAADGPPSKLLIFYLCMVILAAPGSTPEESARRAEILGKNKPQLDALAASSVQGFLHMKVLVDAEQARADKDVERAVRLYEQAIDLSRERRAPHIEALACELYGKFYIGLGAMTAAGSLMRDAYRAYLHWGAVSKAEALEAEYAHLLPSLHRERSRKKTTTTKSEELTNTSSTLLGRTTLGSLRDAALVLRAAQAIAGEIDLPKVIERLSTLVLENSGAQRGALILSRDGQLVVSALFGDAAGAVDEGHGKRLDEVDDMAKSVIFYVARTQESAVLDNASAATRFAEDPYIRSGAPKSLLCLPLLHQARLSGVLYLENKTTTGIFDAARVELLALLSSQAAIAIENARLISGVRSANAEVKRANERLELDVARRTEEIRRANRDLLAAKERLELELAQSEQIERERAGLQEQIITAQRARLAEMSTPLIPITDEIVVMPLIGTLDRDRTQQVLTAALEGAQRHRAQIVILDITGIQQIDTNVAGMLIGVAGALRLLGTEAVLTGIAPTIAQTLVGLGIDLTTLVTMGTLQSGMTYALQRVRSSRYNAVDRARPGSRLK